MSKTIDTRGFSCPQPVLMFMEALKSSDEKEIIILADTDASKENVIRAAENKNFTAKDIKKTGDEYKILLVKD